MDASQFALTRLAAQILDPLMWVWALLVLAGVLWLWPRARHWGKRLALAAAAWLFLLGWEPSFKLAFRTIENVYPPVRDVPAEVQGMIVMGGGAEHDSTIDDAPHVFADFSIERLSRSWALAHAHPKWTVVFTGNYGKGTVQPAARTEAQAALDYWKAKGLPPNPVLMEERSHNTAENAMHTARLLGDRKAQPWLLVTSAWHMPRAMTAYRRAGVNVQAYPVDFRVRQPLSWSNYSLSKGRYMWHMVITEHVARVAVWWQVGWG